MDKCIHSVLIQLWHYVTNVIPRMAIKALFQAFLIQEVANEAHTKKAVKFRFSKTLEHFSY